MAGRLTACLASDDSLAIAETCICSLLALSLDIPTISFMLTAGPSTSSKLAPSGRSGSFPYLRCAGGAGCVWRGVRPSQLLVKIFHPTRGWGRGWQQF